MTAVWPLTLPQSPLINTWKEEPLDDTIIYDTDAGEPPIRARSTGVFWICSAEFLLTESQRTAFWAFFLTTIKKGSLPFTWAHPIDGSTYTWVWDVKRAKMPQLVQDYPYYRLGFAVLRMP